MLVRHRTAVAAHADVPPVFPDGLCAAPTRYRARGRCGRVADRGRRRRGRHRQVRAEASCRRIGSRHRADSGAPLLCHRLIRVGERRWFWYQRYHHLLVDGFSFPAITRHIARIYAALLAGEPLPDSPFTPFAEVVEEYQRYRDSDACRRDKAFWAQQRADLPPPRRSPPRRCPDAPPVPISGA
ncbi:hypothetical protein F1652_14180 [Pluralibacter gergoviae]|nr:hypothetical protein [Pluralibacter gergoviae]